MNICINKCLHILQNNSIHFLYNCLLSTHSQEFLKMLINSHWRTLTLQLMSTSLMVLTSIAPTPGLAFSGVVEPEQTLDLVATTDCI